MVQTYYENSSDHSRFVDDETASDFRKFARPFPSVPSPLLFRFHFSLFFSLSLVPLPFFPLFFHLVFPLLFPSSPFFTHPSFRSQFFVFGLKREKTSRTRKATNLNSYHDSSAKKFFTVRRILVTSFCESLAASRLELNRLRPNPLFLFTIFTIYIYI